jgi:hypothetical protein
MSRPGGDDIAVPPFCTGRLGDEQLTTSSDSEASATNFKDVKIGIARIT